MPLGPGREEYVQTMEPLDPVHYVPHAAPAALFFQFGFYDQSISPQMAQAYSNAASEPVQVSWYHAGHLLDTQALVERAEWLAEQLDLDTTPLDAIRPAE